jgi:hypothetical protein
MNFMSYELLSYELWLSYELPGYEHRHSCGCDYELGAVSYELKHEL